MLQTVEESYQLVSHGLLHLKGLLFTVYAVLLFPVLWCFGMSWRCPAYGSTDPKSLFCVATIKHNVVGVYDYSPSSVKAFISDKWLAISSSMVLGKAVTASQFALYDSMASRCFLAPSSIYCFVIIFLLWVTKVNRITRNFL